MNRSMTFPFRTALTISRLVLFRAHTDRSSCECTLCKEGHTVAPHSRRLTLCGWGEVEWSGLENAKWSGTNWNGAMIRNRLQVDRRWRCSVRSWRTLAWQKTPQGRHISQHAAACGAERHFRMLVVRNRPLAPMFSHGGAEFCVETRTLASRERHGYLALLEPATDARASTHRR